MDAELREILVNMQNSILSIGVRLDRIDNRLDRIEERMDRLEERMDCLEERVDQIEDRITSLESVVKETRIILEHDTNRKITALFDGREDELRYRDLIIIHDKEIRNIKPRLNNIEIAYGRHLAEYHPS